MIPGDRLSEDEELIFDLVNGIVLTGEAALHQLEASIAKCLKQRAENKDMTASSHCELATGIETDCEERGIILEGTEWRLLEQLFTILRTYGDDKRYEVTKLLEDSIGLPTSNRLSLPTIMLRALCKRPPFLIRQKNRPYSITRLVQDARLWALRLVHSVNLAIYLGVAQEFFRFAETNLMTPLHVPSISTSSIFCTHSSRFSPAQRQPSPS